jgi:hypothetical protein
VQITSELACRAGLLALQVQALDSTLDATAGACAPQPSDLAAGPARNDRREKLEAYLDAELGDIDP